MAELYLAEKINLKYQSQIMKYSTQMYKMVIKWLDENIVFTSMNYV